MSLKNKVAVVTGGGSGEHRPPGVSIVSSFKSLNALCSSRRLRCNPKIRLKMLCHGPRNVLLKVDPIVRSPIVVN
jgi:hypothetical protein